MPKVKITDSRGLEQSAGSGLQVESPVRLRSGNAAGGSPGLMVGFQAAAAPGTGNQTITITQLKTGILYDDPEGAGTWTLPTATLLLAGLPGYVVGDCLDFSVINNATTGVDEIITMAVGTGGTAAGNMLVAGPNVTEDQENAGSGLFRIRITSSTAYTCYRLA
tara:strand:- start:219 stop:710 length:492 start_codon:yes stop_codon:yes gene_type:complete